MKCVRRENRIATGRRDDGDDEAQGEAKWRLWQHVVALSETIGHYNCVANIIDRLGAPLSSRPSFVSQYVCACVPVALRTL